MNEESLQPCDQDYIDNMDLEEATKVFLFYIEVDKIAESDADKKKAFELILEHLKLVLKVKEDLVLLWKL